MNDISKDENGIGVLNRTSTSYEFDDEYESKQKSANTVESRQHLHELRERIHQKLIERLDFSHMAKKDADFRRQVREGIEELCDQENALLNYADRAELINQVLNETFGLGPLESLLDDTSITDILVNGAKKVYIERDGVLELTNLQFKDDHHLLNIIDRIVSPLGRRCDEVSPMVDARLPDGSRVNAIIPPLSIDGPTLSIRRFGANPIHWDNLVDYNTLNQEMIDFLDACVKSKLNIVIVGGTGSGKTTLLNNLSGMIPTDERIITIEDAAELILQQPHVVRLETRPPNIEGKGRITIRDLLINALRMRPDRIIVGEVRGAEALDMLQAMNTGHEGSMTTIHANSPRDAISRLETMVSMAGYDLPVKSVRQQFASAVNVLIQVARLTGGPRRILKISEVAGMEDEMITLQDIFIYKQEGVDRAGKAYGAFYATGLRPSFVERFGAFGLDLSLDIFERRMMMKDY
jgi:pilus assembly protein CpaF